MTVTMDEDFLRATAHLDNETAQVKPEPDADHQPDTAPSPQPTPTELFTVLRDITDSPKPTESTPTSHPKSSNLSSRRSQDASSRRTLSRLASSDATTPCLMCPSASKLVCHVCDSISYCTSACSNADSKAHQTLCNTRAEYVQRPNEAMRRAIYFPESPSESIRFTWVKFQEAWTEDNERHEIALVGGFFNVPQNQRSSYYITRNEVLCRRLSHTIRVIAANDECPFNQINSSVAKHIDQHHAHRWKGPLLAIALQNTASNPELPLGDDIAIEDLRHVLDFLNTHNSTALSTDLERYFGRTDEFEAVRVPTTHSVFHQTGSCTLPISEQVEIPIIYAKSPRRADREALQETEKSGKRKSDWNSAFRDLRQSWLLSSQEDFAEAAFIRVSEDEMVAEYYLGSAILVRQDEKPLCVKHVEALWRYNKYLLEPKMTIASRTVVAPGSAGQANGDEQMVETYLCKARFAQFYSDGQCFQRTAAERAVPSPYEVKKQKGTLKRKSSANFFTRITRKSKWEWTSDCDRDSGAEE